MLTVAIAAWRPLEHRAEAHLDEETPIIDRPNVPRRNDVRREEIQAYSSKMMDGYWKG